VLVYESEVHRRKLHNKYLHDFYCTAIRWIVVALYRNISTVFGTGTQKKRSIANECERIIISS